MFAPASVTSTSPPAGTCTSDSTSVVLSIGLLTTTAVAIFDQLLFPPQLNGLQLTCEERNANEGYAKNLHCVSILKNVSPTVVESSR